ncbi:MAG: hypothetical protein A2798_01045 [Candidatus Levybacteria bacterium RIFCSPHIGHO2_01_FULL_37_17]|nr:MAG: hypothetical protein A2798_01045 [Candidatus Levybacteria bacterium RIFCSPHIGHO2_01_FULL_37_17]OGH37038.1 MAG: hypothetical protein A2959_01905 [Candidatus Levybacteria bacterium RIFCSPLOWO2_01_FULL_38_23]
MIKASEKLFERRLELDLTLEEVEKSTKIKAEYLDLIDKGMFEELPSASHASGFVKNYANFMGISEKEIMPLFRREYDPEKEYRVLPKGFEGREEFQIKSFKFSQTLLIAGVIFTIFIAYILFQYRYAFIDPPLTIYSPKDRSVIVTQELQVIGKTEPETNVYINKDPVTVDKGGNFSKTIGVFPGNFILNVDAENNFGKKTSKKLIVEIKSGY